MTPRLFLDTSAVVKHYHTEPGTAAIDALLATPAAEFFVSQLTTVEFDSSLAKLVRVGGITGNAFRLLVRRFEGDLRRRRYRVVRLTQVRCADARHLIRRHALVHNLRALDALQLAAALSLQTPGMPVTLASADQALCRIAVLEGLTVINPELP